MKMIPLTQGLVAQVDEEDYQALSVYTWCAHKDHKQDTWYAQRQVRLEGAQRQTTVLMHRVITRAPNGVPVDHRSGDGLDNRRANLRLAGDGGNQQNRRRNRRATNAYKGVTFHKKTQKWQAQIRHQNRTHYLGLHRTPEDAARAYDCAARELFGEFARPNFAEGESDPAVTS